MSFYLQSSKGLAFHLYTKEMISLFVQLYESLVDGVTSLKLQSSYLKMVAEFISKITKAFEWDFPLAQVVDLRGFPH